jgi:hypothetical protein
MTKISEKGGRGENSFLVVLLKRFYPLKRYLYPLPWLVKFDIPHMMAQVKDKSNSI